MASTKLEAQLCTGLVAVSTKTEWKHCLQSPIEPNKQNEWGDPAFHADAQSACLGIAAPGLEK